MRLHPIRLGPAWTQFSVIVFVLFLLFLFILVFASQHN